MFPCSKVELTKFSIDQTAFYVCTKSMNMLQVYSFFPPLRGQTRSFLTIGHLSRLGVRVVESKNPSFYKYRIKQLELPFFSFRMTRAHFTKSNFRSFFWTVYSDVWKIFMIHGIEKYLVFTWFFTKKKKIAERFVEVYSLGQTEPVPR